MFTIEQKAFLKTLANMGENGPYLSNEIEKLASTTYGVKFDEKNLPKTVLYPLEKAGYISLERGTKAIGRGAKPFQVRLTDKMKSELISPIIESLQSQAHPELRPMLRKPLSEILKELSSDDKHIKGLALEALGFYLNIVLNLANQEMAILLTADKDFGELVFRQRRLTSGVVLIRLAGLSPDFKAELVASAISERAMELTQAIICLRISYELGDKGE